MAKKQLPKMLERPSKEDLQSCQNCDYLLCRFQGKRLLGFCHNCSEIMRVYDLMKNIGKSLKEL